MAKKDPVAAAAQKYKPMQSAVPGTTLGPIQIDAFLGAGVVLYSLCHFLITIKIFCFFMEKNLLQKLYDTPGVHLHHRQAAVVQANDLPSLAPQSRLKPRYFPV